MTDKPGRILWLNGSFVAEDDARVSPLDRGFLYGDAFSKRCAPRMDSRSMWPTT